MVAFSCYLGTDRNALLLCKNDRETRRSLFLDLNVPESLASCTCVFPGGSGMFLPPSAPARGSFYSWCGCVCVHVSPEKQTGLVWGLWMVLSEPHGLELQNVLYQECSRYSSLCFWGPGGSWHTLMQSAEPAHREYWHMQYWVRQRSSTWCWAEPLSCLLLFVVCSVSLGHLCS